MKKLLYLITAASVIGNSGLAQTTVESCNRTVSFDAPPKRAISNDVNLTEMMLVLDLADHMVGYTGISGWKTLDEEMRANVNQLPELSSKYPTKEVIVGANADFSMNSHLKCFRNGFLGKHFTGLSIPNCLTAF